MDPRGPTHHHHHNHHQPPQLPPHIMAHHHNYTPSQQQQNPQMITPLNSSSILHNTRFFHSGPKPGSGHDGLNFDGSGSGSGFGSEKKKRGRPRKYSPDNGGNGNGNGIALGLSPTPLSPSIGPDSGGTGPDSENSGKRHRGRPPSLSKKQLDALGNCGVGFTPHVILVNAGEDIAQKIVAFSKQGPRTVCVLSANGAICNVSLRQPAHTGGVVNYEGRYEIISLSGSFLFSENNGGQVRTGGLSVSLAGSDGRVLGGGVAGMLMAATPIQIIVGSFIANGKKTKYMPSVPQSHALSFAPPPSLPTPESPPSQEVSSEGSEENGSNHIDRTMGHYSNSNHSMHNIQMYNPMGWPNSASKMLQN